MPLDIGETINNFADAFLSAPAVHTIAQNPIYTALVITFLVMLIILFVFRDADTDESLLIMSLRSGFWVFLMLLGVLLIHNRVLGIETAESSKNAAYEGVFNSTYNINERPSTLEDSIVPVTINTSFLN